MWYRHYRGKWENGCGYNIIILNIHSVRSRWQNVIAIRRHHFSRVYIAVSTLYIWSCYSAGSVVVGRHVLPSACTYFIIYIHFILNYYAPTRYSDKKQLVVGSLRYRIPRRRERPRELCDGNPWSNHLCTGPIVVACW